MFQLNGFRVVVLLCGLFRRTLQARTAQEEISASDDAKSCVGMVEREPICSSLPNDKGEYNNVPHESKTRELSCKWKPEADHRCNIVRMTFEDVFDTFGPTGVPSQYHEPLVILNDPKRNPNLTQKTGQNRIVESFPPGFLVTLSSSNSYSARRRTIPLQQYMQEVLSSETTPNHLSNETWYLFGETYSDEWKELLQDYELPPCQTCTNKELVSLSFGIGNKGSGAQWHTHGPGFSHALHGRKHWVLFPSHQKPTYHPDQTPRNWMEHTYTNLTSSELPYECTLDPGDLIYFPDGWYHAIINLDRYTAFVSSFTTEHMI